MKKLIVLLAVIITFTQNPANAADNVNAGDLVLSAGWSRASTVMERPGAAFLSIANTGSADDRLIAAHTPAAKRAELHHHTMNKGVMKMRQIKAMDIPEGDTTMLKPGSFHIMLFQLKSMLNEGDMFPMTLTFEKAGNVTIMVHVAKAGSRKAHESGAKHLQDIKSQDHMKHSDTLEVENYLDDNGGVIGRRSKSSLPKD
jgi:copper(I)-binding protein